MPRLPPPPSSPFSRPSSGRPPCRASSRPHRRPRRAPAHPRRAGPCAVTVDDLPFVGYGLPLGEVRPLSRDLVAALAARKVPAVAFVNEDRLFVPGEVDARIALLTEWLDAGMELGNHTFGHPASRGHRSPRCRTPS